MASLQSIVFYCLATTFFFGQLLRLEVNNVSFPLIDIFIILFSVINIISKLKSNNLKIENYPLLLFLLFAWLSFFINFIFFKYPLLKPLLYLLRLNSLLFLFIFPPALNKKGQSFFDLVLFANIIFGFMQYFLWPNMSSLASLGWDPHLYRLVSTFLDPTFTGLIYLLFLIKTFFKRKLLTTDHCLLAAIYFALALTYSRSTLLSFFISFSYLSISLKKSKLFIFTLFITLSTFLALPRLEGEGTNLQRTSTIKAKIENYKEGWTIFTKSPLIGHGYNNLSSVRQSQNKNSHAISGFDSSLLTIATTTGIIGFLLFTFGLKNFFFSANLKTKTMILAILIHSFFANSLLYPLILLLLAVNQSKYHK